MEGKPDQGSEDRMLPDAERSYRNNQISIKWEPALCIHAGNCYRGLPLVFKPNARPWIAVNEADADEISRIVTTCPTGALHFQRLDDGPQEIGAEPAIIETRPNGPLFLRGRMRIMSPAGKLIREDTRIALCRCGQSNNKPFCDGSHRRVGFRTEMSC